MSALKVFGVLFGFFLSLFLVNPVFAQTAATSASQSAIVNSEYTPLPPRIDPQSPQYSNVIIVNLLHSLNCLITGDSFLGEPCVDYVAKVAPDGKTSMIPSTVQEKTSDGLLGVVTALNLGLIMTPPVYTADYIASIKEGIGLVPEAHAQVPGSGNGVLSPIFSLWRVSRDISYLLMIIIFVIIGIMVMLRNRINPQTVISVQAALPGLVIGLIMITFSYFMAAFISDFAFIGTDLVGFYFNLAEASANPPSPTLTQATSNQPVTTIFSTLINTLFRRENSALGAWGNNPDIIEAVSQVYNTLQGFPRDAVDWMVRFGLYSLGAGVGGAIGGFIPAGGTPGALVNLLSAPVGGILANFLGSAAGYPAVLALLLSFVAAFTLLYTLLRLLIKLIGNYLSIIFLTISAPFTFLIGSMPGRQGMISTWVRNMLCNVLAFPAVMGVLYFAAFVIGRDSNTVFNISNTAQVTGTQAFPLLGGFSLDFIRIILAFGALVGSPAIPDIICKTIGKPTALGQAIEQEFNTSRREGAGYQARITNGIRGVQRAYPDIRTRNEIRDRFYRRDEDGNYIELPPWMRWFGVSGPQA